MPYIQEARRDLLLQYDEKSHQLRIATMNVEGPGDLAYVIYRICQLYVIKHGRSFAVLNAIVGVLTTTKDEFTRRVLAPYEDRKMRENGDVG